MLGVGDTKCGICKPKLGIYTPRVMGRGRLVHSLGSMNLSPMILNSWRGANDWQQYLVDYFGKAMYENDQTVKYAVDSLISYANNDDGRGGHQDFLHDDQSTAIKMVNINRFLHTKFTEQRILQLNIS